MPADSDWRDGFLFLGNQLSLDFLNTRPVIDGSPVELLPDGNALLRWLAAAHLLTKRQATGCALVWPPEAESQLDAIRDFREAFRQVVFEREAGRNPTPAFVNHLNGLLAAHPFVDEVIRSGPRLERRHRFDPQLPADALGPILDAAVDLLVNADPIRTRKCDSCVLHFQDTSKKGTRRWCSMQMCGNRNKVAAYAQRQRSV